MSNGFTELENHIERLQKKLDVCEAENKAYRGILGEIKNNPFKGGDIEKLIEDLETKYLGGKE